MKSLSARRNLSWIRGTVLRLSSALRQAINLTTRVRVVELDDLTDIRDDFQTFVGQPRVLLLFDPL